MELIKGVAKKIGILIGLNRFQCSLSLFVGHDRIEPFDTFVHF